MTKIRNPQQLIDAAARVFAEKGYEASRLEDIAAELGVLQGSLYYHIDSKAGLLRMVQRRRFLEIVEEIEKIAASSVEPRLKLKRAIREQLRYIERYLPEASEWFTNPFDRRLKDQEAEGDRLLAGRYRAGFHAIVSEGIAAGVIRGSADPTVTVLSILGMCNFVGRWYDPDGPRSIDQIATAQFELVWAGLSKV